MINLEGQPAIDILESLVPALRPECMALPVLVTLHDAVHEDVETVLAVLSSSKVTNLQIQGGPSDIFSPLWPLRIWWMSGGFLSCIPYMSNPQWKAYRSYSGR